MPAKTKTIKLTDGIAPAGNTIAASETEWRKTMRFRVEQVTDSIEFHTGQLLERAEVEQLCASQHWKVTIVPSR